MRVPGIHPFFVIGPVGFNSELFFKNKKCKWAIRLTTWILNSKLIS